MVGNSIFGQKERAMVDSSSRGKQVGGIVCFGVNFTMRRSLILSLLCISFVHQAKAQSLPQNPNTTSPLHSVSPSSPIEMRLHPAVLPQEAEVLCSTSASCLLGLSRGFAVGGDLLQTAGVTTLGQHFLGSGAWTYLDVNVAYQFLRRGERQSSFNAAIGYRNYSYKNSDDAKLSRSGLTLRTAYAESVYPAYTQGMVFEIHSSTLSTEGGADRPFDRNDPKRVRSVIKEFAAFARTHPSLRLQLPADLEIVNWKASDLELEAPIRGYLRITPTYEQSDLVLRDVEETRYSWIEKRYALQLMLIAAYAAPTEKSGRYGLLGGLGLEMGSSRPRVESKVPADGVSPVIPTAPMVRGKLEIQASYQF